MAYYQVLFDRAVDEAFALCGLGPDYVSERNASFFLVESRISYRRELKFEDPVRATLHLVAHDDKRIHYAMELRHAVDGWLAASCENISINVDMGSRRAAPLPSRHPRQSLGDAIRACRAAGPRGPRSRRVHCQRSAAS